MRRRALCGDSPAGCRRRSPACVRRRGSCHVDAPTRVWDSSLPLALWANAPAQLCLQSHPRRRPIPVASKTACSGLARMLLPAPALICLRAADGPAHKTERPSLPCAVPSQICQDLTSSGRVAAPWVACSAGEVLSTPWGSLLCHHLCPLGGRVGGMVSFPALVYVAFLAKTQEVFHRHKVGPERTGVHVYVACLGVVCCKHHWRSDTTPHIRSPHASPQAVRDARRTSLSRLRYFSSRCIKRHINPRRGFGSFRSCPTNPPGIIGYA